MKTESWDQEVMLMAYASLLKSIVSCMLFVGENQAEVSRKLNQTMLIKRTRDTSDTAVLGQIPIPLSRENCIPKG